MSAMAELVHEAALLRRYFGQSMKAAAAVAASTSTKATETLGARATAQIPSPVATSAVRTLHTSASNAEDPTLSEAARFLCMFGQKNTTRATDPMIVAAFSSSAKL